MSESHTAALQAAAEAIRHAEALLIGAGAGMGVDAGLPDFRGPEGFWKAYPPFRGRAFEEISNPQWFASDPTLAWGFFGHRLNLYRAQPPHVGYETLRQWSARAPNHAFVFTSNVDGHFARAGFLPNKIWECHGSIHFWQCFRNCCDDIWPAEARDLEVDIATIRCQSPLPECPHCGAVARPNILMFYDQDWQEQRAATQARHFNDWLKHHSGKSIVAIELGAGLAVPTVRRLCEQYASTLIRVNPREAETPPGGISLPLPALEALQKIEALLSA